jgi:hypothetical protein
MRTKRFLLVTAALSTAAAASACGKDQPPKPDASETLPLPANPKGSFYDAGSAVDPIPPEPLDAGATSADAGSQKSTPPAVKDAGTGPIRNRLPANPKGSHYDAGRRGTADDLF